MARVTIEKALENVSNPFELVKVAIKRVAQLEQGQKPLVEKHHHLESNMIIALREIEEKQITKDLLNQEEI